jgi:GT2 family glycosyltransferase
MEISIIIPNYNGRYLLEKNLPEVLSALREYKNGKKEIVIVDDASADDSVLSIKKFISNINAEDIAIKILENERNLGFASTVNRGVNAARGDIVVLLNTDVCPEGDFLPPLLKRFDDPKVFAVGCMDKSIEDGKTILRGRGLGRWQRGFLVHRRGEVDKDDTLWVSGGSGAFRKDIWKILGGMNEIYNPFYYEDIDLSYRALKSGFKIYFEPKSIVVHEHEKGAIKSKYSTQEVKRIAYRNQLLFVWMNATDLSLELSHIIWLPYQIIKALFRSDWQFIKGFFDALIMLPKVIKSRLRNKKYFVKKDREVIQKFDL